MFREFINLMMGNGDYFSLVAHVLAIVMVIFLVLPFHEWAHAWVASLMGDKSIKYRGRLSLNPMSHIDYIGALCLLLFGFGWAKPVPVDARSFKNPKFGMAIVSLAGPLANIVAAIFGGFIHFALVYFAPEFYFLNEIGIFIRYFISYYVAVNCSLAVFNLLPIPPLDGSKILFAFLPDKAAYALYRNQQIFSIALLAMMFFGVLSTPLYYLQSWILQFVNFICQLPYELIVG
ncbi:MAG: site-2 protease family protein [Eubacteriales bacterium]|nr:site-2 protease family protein [Eubacteriales bacterium]